MFGIFKIRLLKTKRSFCNIQQFLKPKRSLKRNFARVGTALVKQQRKNEHDCKSTLKPFQYIKYKPTMKL